MIEFKLIFSHYLNFHWNIFLFWLFNIYFLELKKKKYMYLFISNFIDF